MTYEKRMEKLGLTSLEDRRIRGHMIETFKIMPGKINVSRNLFFKMALIRGNSEEARNLKIFKKRFNWNKRKYFFSQRVI